MILNWKKSESGVYPELIDDTSSKIVTYLRKNVAEKQVTDEMTGESHTMYVYEEAKLTKEQYDEYLKHPELWTMEELEKEVYLLKKENAELNGIINTMLGV